MLVIFVTLAVIGYTIYTFIRFKLHEWSDDCRMSQSSLKEVSEHDCQATTESENVIEISSDESNPSQCKVISETEDEETDHLASTSIRNYSRNRCKDASLKTYGRRSRKNTGDVKTEPNSSAKMDSSNKFAKRRGNNASSGLKSGSSFFSWGTSTSSESTKKTGAVRKKRRNTVDRYREQNVSDDSDQSSEWFETQMKRKFKHSGSGNASSQLAKYKCEVEDPKKTERDETIVPQVVIHNERMISGVKVKFPMKPYPCQLAVMSNVIKGCIREQNCLLESPTGSGKTLALLCSVLAWQDHYTAEIKKQSTEKPKGSCSPGNDKPCTTSDFKENCTDTNDDYAKDLHDMSDDEKGKMPKVPKVYYGTRTHRQIEQVVRELRKTAYNTKKMTILSSREHTCIQESTRNKTELCNDLLDPTKFKRCQFYHEDNKKALTTFGAALAYGLSPVWDIEDIVSLGRKEEVCPYFAARNLMTEADIIFCPYNYLVDPGIRESMQIDVKGQIIILDEAHNIEDICRDVASVTFREDHLMAAAVECEILMNKRIADSHTYEAIRNYIQKLVTFIKETGVNKNDYNSNDFSSPYWTGTELKELLCMKNIGESAHKSFLVAGKAAIEDMQRAKEQSRTFHKESVKPIISTATKIILEHLMFGIESISSVVIRDDYRACVTDTVQKDVYHMEDNTWYPSKRQEQRVRTLKLVCMNPGVIFSTLSEDARVIVLASGTLSPTMSFESELCTKFLNHLNAPHVIPKEQVFATCVPRGPSGVMLRANYKNVNVWSFQDEVGLVLIDICKSVPYGILCFFSSYTVMHKLIERWKGNSIWYDLTGVKKVFIEPRRGNDLNIIMTEYRQVIQDTSNGLMGSITGALLFAVVRGKVAEGIDFKDDEARCVITVGIPYPVRTDPIIAMKMKYNDLHVSKGLLNGSAWYIVQAFRALNQALGRCLRHVDDWGAVLLMDERFLDDRNTAYLPKWVKSMWAEYTAYNLKDNLQHFVARQTERGKKQLTEES